MSRKVVLIVDDDADIREILAETLGSMDFDCATAVNGLDALAVVRKMAVRPSIILLDLMMPVMDGWQLLDELKRDETIADIPVVVISAGKVDPRTPGPHEVLNKPLDYHKLVATLDRSMRPAVEMR